MSLAAEVVQRTPPKAPPVRALAGKPSPTRDVRAELFKGTARPGGRDRRLISAAAAVLSAVLLYLYSRPLSPSAHRSLLATGPGGASQLPQQQLQPQAPAPENIFVIRTHELTGRTWSQYERMRAALGEWVFILVADSQQPLYGERIYRRRWAPPQKQVLLVNEEECRNASALHTEMYVTGQTPLALMGKYLEGIDYRFLWFIDWDAVCNGDYAKCFQLPAGFDQDFVALYTAPWSKRLKWRWSELTGELASLPLEKRWKSFFPIVRLSKAFVGRIYEDMQVSAGLCELYVPSLCAATPGCTIGEFPAELVGFVDYIDPLIDANFHCTIPAEPDHKWYHPCKFGEEMAATGAAAAARERAQQAGGPAPAEQAPAAVRVVRLRDGEAGPSAEKSEA